MGVVRLVDPESRTAITSLVLQDTLASGGEGVLLGLAVDPAFDRTRVIYVLQTASSRDGLTYQIVRYRGVAGIFGERAVLLETGRADAAEPSGTIRVGADGKLYAAILEARSQREPGDLRGVILRLNPDGTTPTDQLSGSPVFAAGGRELRGLDWHPRDQRLWLAQDGGGAPPRLLSVARDRRRAREGLTEEDYPLPDTTRVSALRFYDAPLIPSLRGLLLVAGDGGLHAVSFDPQDASRIVSIDRLLDVPLRAIAVAADGTLFVATSDAVFRAAPR
jgi:glucose/arabinose dehydrogenase